MANTDFFVTYSNKGPCLDENDLYEYVGEWYHTDRICRAIYRTACQCRL
jgi:hypothetical protein